MLSLPGLSKERRHSLAFLNLSQFLGAMNDNMFKLILVFLVIDIKGPEKANLIVSAAGATFVLPFLLFSSTAGVLADRFSKQKLLVMMKIAEVLIMTLALFAFGYRSIWAGYTLLFLLASHSAMFGPSKYGIIPEIVVRDRVSKANGLITGFTYLAMILGTFFASFFTEITGRKFVLTAAFCLVMALIGLASSFGIKRTLPQGSEKEINPLFLREIYRTLCFCKGRKHLLLSIFGSAYFLFIGAFTQLNIIPYAMQSLHLSDIAGGYLFLPTALGIAIGSFIAGKASKKQIELGLSCLAGVAISLLLFLLSATSTSLITAVLLLILLGIFGGAFIVPFDSYTQLASPHEHRGQVIAAANFLSFCGVLVASIALYLFGNVLELSSATGFAVLGGCTLLVSLWFIGRLSDLSLPYFARKASIFWKLKITGSELLEKSPDAVVILENPSMKKALILLDLIPNAQLFVIKSSEKNLSWLNKLFFSVHFLTAEKGREKLPEPKEEMRPCFLGLTSLPAVDPKALPFWKRFSRPNASYILVDIQPGPYRQTVSFKELLPKERRFSSA
ncbi:MAG: MFS transporter [Chlamydiales bacterium]|nr:MFS transporter [Chlamydiales bacterium]